MKERKMVRTVDKNGKVVYTIEEVVIEKDRFNDNEWGRK